MNGYSNTPNGQRTPKAYESKRLIVSRSSFHLAQKSGGSDESTRSQSGYQVLPTKHDTASFNKEERNTGNIRHRRIIPA